MSCYLSIVVPSRWDSAMLAAVISGMILTYVPRQGWREWRKLRLERRLNY